MSIIDSKNMLRELTVQEAMRRLVIRVSRSSSIEGAIRLMIKYKVNAVLVTDEEEDGIGIVSKTDLMGAYYAELPIATAVEGVMTGPPLFCYPDDSLDSALQLMRARSVHRLYVAGDIPTRAIGVLAYPDIVGMLYRYCRKCDRSITRPRAASPDSFLTERIEVGEVMTPSVHTHGEEEALTSVMEGLSTTRLGATLISDTAGFPVGVISKTDLILAYRHGVSTGVAAGAVMRSPVISCSFHDPLAAAIQKMIFSDVHRMFVYRDDPARLTGVISLSDAARVRSGTCRACTATRVKIGETA